MKRTRRTFVTLLVGLAVLIVGCGGEEEREAAPRQADKPVTGTFIGEVPGTDAFVAVVASEPEQGQQERKVVAYLCQVPFGWFTGSASGNTFSLTGAARDPDLGKQNAEKVEVRLTDGAATGKFTLANGRELSFTARPLTGVAGLYQMTLPGGRRLTGPSSTGGKVVADIALRPEGGRAITGRFIGPDGSSVPVNTTIGSQISPGDLGRLIVFPDGRFQGKWQKQGSSSFSDWWIGD